MFVIINDGLTRACLSYTVAPNLKQLVSTMSLTTDLGGGGGGGVHVAQEVSTLIASAKKFLSAFRKSLRLTQTYIV
jgi:hypothetical protein